MLEMQFFFFSRSTKVLRASRGFILYHHDLIFLFHQPNKNFSLLFFAFWRLSFFSQGFSATSHWPKGLMWFMTVVPDMYHHHPTLESRMAGNFFFFFPLFLQSETRLSSATPARSSPLSHLSNDERAPAWLHFYSPAKTSAGRRSPGIHPRRLTEYIICQRKCWHEALFRRTKRKTHSLVASPPRAGSDEVIVLEIWPFLCPPPARPWSVIWPARCWDSTWQQNRRRWKEWKWKQWAKPSIDVIRFC